MNSFREIRRGGEIFIKKHIQFINNTLKDMYKQVQFLLKAFLL